MKVDPLFECIFPVPPLENPSIQDFSHYFHHISLLQRIGLGPFCETVHQHQHIPVIHQCDPEGHTIKTAFMVYSDKLKSYSLTTDLDSKPVDNSDTPPEVAIQLEIPKGGILARTSERTLLGEGNSVV